LCADFPPQCAGIDVVDECAPAVDLDDRQPFPVLRLELRIPRDVHLAEGDAALSEDRARALAEVATRGVEQDDVGYG
jgi:hypothetical protein